MTISRTDVAGSSNSSTTVAPRNVSLISLGCSWANESDDWLYNAAVIRSADFKPSSGKSEYKKNQQQHAINSLRHGMFSVELSETDLRGRVASLVGLIYDEPLEILV